MKNIKIIVGVLLLIVVFAAVMLSTCTQRQREKIEQLEKKIAFLKEEIIPIRFKIVEKYENSMRVAVKFYDLDGNVINRHEVTLQGSELAFDFYVVQVKDRYIAFPFRIFTDEIAPAGGVELYSFYNKNGFPEIFGETGADRALKEGLEAVFSKLLVGKHDELKNYFGNAVHDIKEFRAFREQQIYKIVAHTKGGIEVLPN